MRGANAEVKEKDTCIAAGGYPRFTKEMKHTHTVLIPQMAPIHFEIIAGVLEKAGYHVEVLKNDGPEVKHYGLKYVHNDICYPAQLVIGQFIDALNSGRYDTNHTALLLIQTGGGCRASNYIHLLRKALEKAGFGRIPVASVNFSGLEKDSSLHFTVSMLMDTVSAVLLSDELMALANQVRPYEDNAGDTDGLLARWQGKLRSYFSAGQGFSPATLKNACGEIAADFDAIPRTTTAKVRVGIVGEIYVKHSPLGNNNLETMLQEQGCEISVPGLMGIVQYSIVGGYMDIDLYGGSKVLRCVYKAVERLIAAGESLMHEAIEKCSGLKSPAKFDSILTDAKRVIGLGAKMGEGWLLAGEIVDLVKNGFENIVCAQPFGCLPNHVVGKGMIAKIRQFHPGANITAIDYDASASAVNQENRIKLMLAVANDELANRHVPEVYVIPAKESKEKMVSIPA